MLVPRVRVARRAPKARPRPACGKRGRRKRTLRRRIRPLAYRQEAHADVYYAEYQARCPCRKSFRSRPLGVPPKADYDGRARDAILDRILEDGLDVERALASVRRDFGLELSQGFVHDRLRWRISCLDLGPHRRMVLERFSGTLCVDELHLGRSTLLLATDPIADLPVAFALVGRDDQDHMRRFPKDLGDWGLVPRVVVTDGPNLHPAVLADLWPAARHQPCVFHVLKDVDELILRGVRRPTRAMARRGSSGRKRKRGRPSKTQRAARAAAGPTSEEEAEFVMRRRFLIAKEISDLARQQWDDSTRMFEYLPGLRTLGQFATEVNDLFEKEGRAQTSYERRAAQLRKETFREVPESQEAVWMLGEGKFEKMVAFTHSEGGKEGGADERPRREGEPAAAVRRGGEVRVGHRKWVLRNALPALDRWWCLTAETARRDGQQRPQPRCRAAWITGLRWGCGMPQEKWTQG